MNAIMNQNQTIGKNLRLFRDQMGLKQDAVAKFLGVQREVISYFENGTREASVENLIKLSDLYGCELSDLLEENPEALNACLAFAFRADQLEDEDLNTIAEFKKIVKNYLDLININVKS